MFEVNEGIIQVSYIIATILFILALGGLSNQETARRGNWYGIAGMAIALIATLVGDVTQHYPYVIVALLIGGTVGIIAARRVQMTQMPELVATLHSLVGLAAVVLFSLSVWEAEYSRTVLYFAPRPRPVQPWQGIQLQAPGPNPPVLCWRLPGRPVWPRYPAYSTTSPIVRHNECGKG